MLGNNGVERIDDGGIFNGLVGRFPVIGSPRECHTGTGLFDRQLFFLNQVLYCSPFLDERQSFFARM